MVKQRTQIPFSGFLFRGNKILQSKGGTLHENEMWVVGNESTELLGEIGFGFHFFENAVRELQTRPKEQIALLNLNGLQNTKPRMESLRERMSLTKIQPAFSITASFATAANSKERHLASVCPSINGH
ncbi:hypothetical protein CEXT_337361 [Caerostris extrusa]|uniref:Uncharacterized protein n=1 Tax=Caerostris extrusa TaxID=172846 RepID=A0AAV4T2K8_CAEEX|nr:hypothetical protein CEXT_337361 [Caerostris extrusa]